MINMESPWIKVDCDYYIRFEKRDGEEFLILGFDRCYGWCGNTSKFVTFTLFQDERQRDFNALEEAKKALEDAHHNPPRASRR